jgi:tetratricopeptide (TPR) repeat protein
MQPVTEATLSEAPSTLAPEEDTSPAARERRERILARTERAILTHDYLAVFATLEHVSFAAFPDLALRALFAESWARMSSGQLERAVKLLERACVLVERPGFDEIDRAEALYRLGCCRLSQSQVADAVSLLAVALELCDRSGLPCDRLRANIFDWRSRCYQRQRDWEAARADVERGIELAGGIDDRLILANLHFQASLIAERERQWLLARFYAEEALAAYQELGERRNTHRVLNNLGGLHCLLGDADTAVWCLQESFRIALELQDDVAAAYAMSSLAQVQLRNGRSDSAKQNARRALELLDGRSDHLGEIGNAQLVLGRALLEEGRHTEAAVLFGSAEQSFERFDSVSHLAAVWVAQGDLAAQRGKLERAGERYRQAAEALQDFNF